MLMLYAHPNDSGINHRNLELGSILYIVESVPQDEESGVRKAILTYKSEIIELDGFRVGPALQTAIHCSFHYSARPAL